MPAPTLAELTALAERAAGMLEGDGQVTVLWELGGPLVAAFVAVVEGRAAREESTQLDDEHLRRAARGAALQARRPRAWPAPPPPEPAPGRAHEGFDAAVLALAPDSAPDLGDNLRVELEARASRVAIASTWGVRSAEERTRVVATVRGVRDGRHAAVTVAAVGMPDVAAAASEAHALLGDGGPAGHFALRIPPRTVVAPAGDGPVVLGPEAVAVVLDRLRSAFGVDLALGGGPLAERRGRRVAAPAVNLSDSSRYPGTLPRSYDAEGVPRQPVPLIQDGVFHRPVHDTASAAQAGAASTGHATRALTLAPLPENLVMVGGGVDDLTGLCAGLETGVFVPRLERADGALRTVGAAAVARGTVTGALAPLVVELDPLAVLASVQALTSRQRLVVLGDTGSAVVPALRAGAGVRLAR